MHIIYTGGLNLNPFHTRHNWGFSSLFEFYVFLKGILLLVLLQIVFKRRHIAFLFNIIAFIWKKILFSSSEFKVQVSVSYRLAVRLFCL